MNLTHSQWTTNASAVAVLGILFFSLPLAYWSGFIEAASLPRYFIIAALAGISCLFWILSLPKTRLQWHTGFFLILLFLVWAVLSRLWSIDPSNYLIEILQLLSMVMLAFLGMQFAATPSYLRIILPAIMIGAMLAALIGVGQNFGFNPFNFRLVPHHIAATFINPNHAANYFDLIIPLALTGVLIYQNTGLRWLSTVSLAAALAFLLVNKSRGSLLALVVSLVVLIILLLTNKPLRLEILSRFRSAKIHLLFAVLFPVIVLLAPAPKDSVARWNFDSLAQHKLDSSLETRLNAYMNALPLISDHPLGGVGYGSFRKGFRPYSALARPLRTLNENSVFGQLHSDPLQYIVELGIPGGILIFAVFFVALRSAFPSREIQIRPNTVLIQTGLFIALIASAIHACIDFPLRLPASAALFWFCIGSVLGLALTSTDKDNKYSFSTTIRTFLAGITGVYLLVTVLFYYQYFRGSHYLYQATIEVLKENCMSSRSDIQKSLEAFSLNYVTQNRYAQIYSYCEFPPAVRLAAMNKILAMDETNVRARLTRGAALIQLNNLSAAEQDLNYVVNILPHRALAYLALGDVAALRKNYPKAKYLYSAALKRDPASKYAKNMLKQLQRIN